MNPDRQQAINYLRAPTNGFWRWSENGAVLVWRDGSTIAFREEIVQVLQWLAPNGLPSFGAIVFLLAACRGKLPTMTEILPSWSAPLPPAMGKDAVSLQGARLQLKAQLEATLRELAKVTKLPAELNSGIKAKCVLAEVVFESAKVERQVEAKAVLSGMREPMSDDELADAESAAVSGRYIRQLHILSEGLKSHSVESLQMRLRTGLDSLPNATEADLPTAERARRLIDELSRDRDLGMVARAARELLAAVRLPRRLGEQDQLSLGGVADITNRGPLDRLLLSELAHDDLTLAVRVALNEALYLRREPPMREPPGALALLLDSGVRLWGVPRVLATAVALALIARDKQHSKIMAWRSHGKQLQPVDLLSRNGLIQHVGSLEPNAHAGDSIPAFAHAISNTAQDQTVLITHRDALTDKEFRRALANNPTAPGFVATVDRDGRFELHAMPLAHRPPLCEADIDLGSVFDEQTSVPPIKIEADPDLPAIFGVSPFPFLMALTGSVGFWTKGADDLNYAVMDDRRLVQFGTQQSGARILATDLPGGPVLWMDCDGSEVQVVKAGSRQRPTRLISLALPHDQPRIVDLTSGPEVQAVHRYGNTIVLIRITDVRAYSLTDGRMLGTLPNPHVWLNGRFFRGTSHFYFVAWDGERLKFEPVIMPSSYLPASVVTLFEREGLAGPWMLCKNGHVVSTESGQVIKLPNPKGFNLNFSTTQISKDGSRLFVPNTPQPDTGGLFELSEKPQFDLRKKQSFVLDSNPGFPTWNVYRAIESVAACEDGILLGTRKNRWWKLGPDQNGKFRILYFKPPSAGSLNERKFPEQRQKTKYGCTLCSVELPNHSKVFLDSRGLLHFKSTNLDLPEASIILADGEIAGWTSDGCICGPAFFFDGPHSSDPGGVFKRILNIVSKQ